MSNYFPYPHSHPQENRIIFIYIYSRNIWRQQKRLDSKMSNTNIDRFNHLKDSDLLSFLDQSQVSMIDEALSALGDYGELRLIVEKGRLRFIVTQKSFDALKWQPGTLEE